MGPASVVMVIDLQVGVLPGCFDVDGVLARTRRLVRRAREAGVPVIWVQDDQDFPRDSREFGLAAPLAPTGGETVVVKSYRDVFTHPALPAALIAAGTRRVILTGAQSDYCVRTAAQRAAAEGYDVTLVSDCHTTCDATTAGGTLTGGQIVAHTNQYFAGLRYPGQTFAVLAQQAVEL